MAIRLCLVSKVTDSIEDDMGNAIGAPKDSSTISKRPEYRTRPVFSSITALELESIISKGDAKVQLNDFERAIYTLEKACDLAIYRLIGCDNQGVINQFHDYMVASMMLCSTFKNFWGYQLQIATPEFQKDGTYRIKGRENDIFRKECNLEDLQPLRWTVTKYSTYQPGPRMPVERVEPLEWAALPPAFIYPTAMDCAFAIRLALARERNAAKKIIDDLSRTATGKSFGQFEPIEGLAGSFVVKISLPGASIGYEAELVKPEVETRLTIAVSVIGGQVHHYTGAVVEVPSDDVADNEAQDWDFVAQVFGPAYNEFEGKTPVKLEFLDDRTAANRSRIALGNMSESRLTREEGVDVQSVIFRTQPTIDPKKQNAGRDLSFKSIIETDQRCKTVFKLNAAQIQAVEQCFSSPTGLALVYGSPGTGKTTTVTAAAHEHVRIKNKVLYTCPSNKAVDAALSAFSKRRDNLDMSNVVAVRFVGGYKTYEERKKFMAPGVDVDQWDGLVNPTITAAARANPEALFHVQLERAITKWTDDKAHAMHEHAKEYLDLLQEEKKGKNTARKLREIRRKIGMASETLTHHFLEHKVDIVFTTCSSACHKTLIDSFKPVVAFLDEAGQANIPDVCMALDPYKEDIKWLVMSGDHNQLMPVVTAKRANEHLSLLERSIFWQLIYDPNSTYKFVMLTTQYRQHPDLSAYNNEQFYDNQIKNAQSTEANTPLMRTVKQFFGRIRHGPNARSAHQRIAIDVSENSTSVRYAETTSFCNFEEAEIIVQLVVKMLAYEPQVEKQLSERYQKIQPEHIGIITAYKGQQRLIRNLLQMEGGDAAEVQVGTVWAWQGGEIEIALISLCVNGPKGPVNKLKFIAIPNSLCVSNSRARLFQVTTGNFTGWCTALGYRMGEGILKSSFNAFRRLVTHHYNAGDIVSIGDVNTALLAATPTKLKISSFYTKFPSINPEQIRKRAQNQGTLPGGKRKGSTSRYDTAPRDKKIKDSAKPLATPVAKTPASTQQLDHNAAPTKSNRAKKKEAWLAKKAALEAEKLQAETEAATQASLETLAAERKAKKANYEESDRWAAGSEDGEIVDQADKDSMNIA